MSECAKYNNGWFNVYLCKESDTQCKHFKQDAEGLECDYSFNHRGLGNRRMCACGRAQDEVELTIKMEDI